MLSDQQRDELRNKIAKLDEANLALLIDVKHHRPGDANVIRVEQALKDIYRWIDTEL